MQVNPQMNQPAVKAPWWSKMAIYWLDDQVAITFLSDMPATAAKSEIIASLNLDGLNRFLKMYGYSLSSFQEHDMRHVAQQDAAAEAALLEEKSTNSDLNSPLGKHLFLHPSGQGVLVKCFFHVEQEEAYAMSGSPVISGVGTGMATMYGGGSGVDTTNAIAAVVNLINNNRAELKQQAQVAIVAASPNWLSGGTPVGGGCMFHACPLTPPVPVEDPSPLWHITLPTLSSTMQQKTGEGVTVFVLDTCPRPAQIIEAAQRAGDNNLLLQTIVKQINGASPAFIIKDSELSLPTVLDTDNPDQPATGRDIYGRLSGYSVADHGLFVAGIIRDLAPAATIECVRVLNDFGVGTLSVLIEALEEIHSRMSPLDPNTGKEGDLYNKPVVINMSMVTMPHEEELVQIWTAGGFSDQVRMTENTEPLRNGLHAIIQSLSALGAIIVSAAGNDSDVRQCLPSSRPNRMIVSTQRMRPRYPAAFSEVISVGAVDGNGHAALYSNDPVGAGSMQHNGVATWGGGIPTPIFPASKPNNSASADCGPFDPSCMTSVDLNTIDAPIGVYTSCSYPSLSAEDVPSEYQAPNNHSWAYWSGTSFATPIISAVAARLLEELSTTPGISDAAYLWHHHVKRAFTNADGQCQWLTDKGPLPLELEFSRDAGINIALLAAQQEKAVETDKIQAQEEKKVTV
ncbi:MAG TPA: S8/S53 family peptidase [Ktedonobacteraceae bacterium]|nr:S8/S53 family peptidase [Ktedonobacteraceae bacterium]